MQTMIRQTLSWVSTTIIYINRVYILGLAVSIRQVIYFFNVRHFLYGCIILKLIIDMSIKMVYWFTSGKKLKNVSSIPTDLNSVMNFMFSDTPLPNLKRSSSSFCLIPSTYRDKTFVEKHVFRSHLFLMNVKQVSQDWRNCWPHIYIYFSIKNLFQIWVKWNVNN